MENRAKRNKYIVLFGRILFLLFLVSASCRIVFREEYSRENYNNVLMVLLGLGIVFFIFKLIYDKKQTISNMKSIPFVILTSIKRRLPEILIIVLFLLLWFVYKRNLV